VVLHPDQHNSDHDRTDCIADEPRFTVAIHETSIAQAKLRVTPAMEAGISDHVWSIGEMCNLLPKPESAAKRIDREITLRALGEKVGA
jgi:hypothetical protein